MDSIRKCTFLLVVLFIIACAFGWGLQWKIIIGAVSILDLTMISARLIAG